MKLGLIRLDKKARFWYIIKSFQPNVAQRQQPRIPLGDFRNGGVKWDVVEEGDQAESDLLF